MFRIFSIAFFLFLFLATEACQDESKPAALSPDAKQQYVGKGKTIAAATFTALSSELQRALQAGGVEGAIGLCSLKALPITDSLSKTNQATIRRTSLKIRNPKNTANEDERAVLMDFEKLLSKGEELKPVVREFSNGSIGFYAPIRINAACLQCHGTVGTDISEADYSVLKEKYPNDAAIGFQDNGLRGIWSITFAKKN